MAAVRSCGPGGDRKSSGSPGLGPPVLGVGRSEPGPSHALPGLPARVSVRRGAVLQLPRFRAPGDRDLQACRSRHCLAGIPSRSRPARAGSTGRGRCVAFHRCGAETCRVRESPRRRPATCRRTSAVRTSGSATNHRGEKEGVGKGFGRAGGLGRRLARHPGRSLERLDLVVLGVDDDLAVDAHRLDGLERHAGRGLRLLPVGDRDGELLLDLRPVDRT